MSANRRSELMLVAGLLSGVAFMGWINKAPVAVAAPAMDYAGIAAVVRAAQPAPAPAPIGVAAIASPVIAAPAPVAAKPAPAPAPVAAKPVRRKVHRVAPAPARVVYYLPVHRCGCGW